ncbi:MAG TPA: hypothetical protein PLA94_27405, partial [Myxococcota bacterium]|nr:hypothetical protein [Myxococcota bacterium]
MLLRPLERGIFDKTRSFFEKNPDEKLLLVIDEAHMYRGTGGAEVAMLLRRLRERLGLPAERLQVICTSASFEGDAGPFAAKLTGKRPEDFNVVRSEVVQKAEALEPTLADVAALCAVERDTFERPELSPAERLAAIMPLVEHRKGAIPELKELLDASTTDPEAALYLALQDWPPLARAFNSAMPGRKQPLSDGYRPGARPFAPLPTGHTQPEKALTTLVFGELGDAPQREQALTTLLALATAARRTPKGDPLLPARAHAFFRGLPGLWVCVDPQCSVLHPSQRGGHTGKLYAQDPGPACLCGARVFPLFTCRDCGTAFARGYTGVSAESYNKDGGQSVTYLWSHDGDFVAGSTADGDVGSLNPVDMLLELPRPEELLAQKGVRVRWLSLATGRLEGRYDEREPHRPGCRPVALPGGTPPTPPARGKKPAKAEPNTRALPPGQFRPCPICRGEGGFGRSTVMDHETKGDQPFSALITGQLEIQRRRPGPAGEAKEDRERRLRH